MFIFCFFESTNIIKPKLSQGAKRRMKISTKIGVTSPNTNRLNPNQNAEENPKGTSYNEPLENGISYVSE